MGYGLCCLFSHVTYLYYLMGQIHNWRYTNDNCVILYTSSWINLVLLRYPSRSALVHLRIYFAANDSQKTRTYFVLQYQLYHKWSLPASYLQDLYRYDKR